MANYGLPDLLYLMSRLRDPNDGCPWDQLQTFKTIAPHTLEECYELIDAIESTDSPQLKEELGDLLFQVVFYAQLASEQQQFDFDQVVDGLVKKLIRRHPHVFPAGTLQSRACKQATATDQIKQQWESTKAAERQQKQLYTTLADVPLALPALSRAAKLQKRASQVGFDWNEIDGVLQQLHSEIDELVAAQQQQSPDAIAEELGDVLFSAVNLARHLKVDPEWALRIANRKFERRFGYIEQCLADAGSSPQQASLEQMDALWAQAKLNGL